MFMSVAQLPHAAHNVAPLGAAREQAIAES
jgi:hypothetical protein